MEPTTLRAQLSAQDYNGPKPTGHRKVMFEAEPLAWVSNNPAIDRTLGLVLQAMSDSEAKPSENTSPLRPFGLVYSTTEDQEAGK